MTDIGGVQVVRHLCHVHLIELVFLILVPWVSLLRRRPVNWEHLRLWSGELGAGDRRVVEILRVLPTDVCL